MAPPTILQNAVEQIAGKLQRTVGEIPRAVLLKTNEQVRILETRIKTGNLGKMDRKESRAAVLLESTYRQETKKPLPWKSLAAVVGIKAPNLQQLQQKINNYMVNSSRRLSGTRTTTNRRLSGANQSLDATSRKRLNPTMLNSQPKRLRTTSTTSRRNQFDASASMQRLNELTIRLSAQMTDPHGSAQKAQQLVANLHHWIEYHPSVSAHERRGLLYDMHRYGPAYEAAALYCVTKPTGKASRKGREDDEPEQRPMDLHDLAEASTDFTYLELQQVLPHVMEMVDKMAQGRKSKDNENLQSKNKPAASTETSQTQSNPMLLDVDKEESLETEPDEPTAVDQEGPTSSFVEWQERIVSEACERARSSLMEARGVSAESITHSDTLAKAAGDILQKYGLISAS